MAISRALFGRGTLALLALGLAALVAIGGASLWLVGEIRADSAETAAGRTARRTVLRVLSLLRDAETSQRGFLLTGEEPYLAPYRRSAAEMPQALADLAGLPDPGLEEARARLGAIADAKMAELAQTVALAGQGRREEALAILRTDRGDAMMEEARRVADAAALAIDARLDRSTAGLAAGSRALLAVTSVGLVAVLLVGAGTALLGRRYTRDLERARAAVDEANAGLEERVRERTADLAAANDEIQRFAYIVSHDLRAPLVNVMGFTAELEVALAALQRLVDAAEAKVPDILDAEMRAAAREDLPEALSFIRSSTERMDRLINAILKLSREGRRALQPEVVKMEELMVGLSATMQHQLDAAGAELRVEAPLPSVISDRLALEQVFGNLVENAVKYLDSGRPGVIVVRGRAEGARAVYEVEDNGRGIEPKDHERIFELFRRSGAQDRPGEGIGLAHVRALVRRLGGSIGLSSEPGRGSVFRVNLPRTATALREGAQA